MSRNLWVSLGPGQWRGEGDGCEPGPMALQIIAGKLWRVPGDPGWVQVQGWRHWPDRPGPTAVSVQVLAAALPADMRP